MSRHGPHFLALAPTFARSRALSIVLLNPWLKLSLVARPWQVELGMLSTTIDREVAVKYSQPNNENGFPTVFEIEVGQVDLSMTSCLSFPQTSLMPIIIVVYFRRHPKEGPCLMTTCSMKGQSVLANPASLLPPDVQMRTEVRDGRREGAGCVTCAVSG